MMSIKEKYDKFVSDNGCNPTFCCCYVMFSDSCNIIDAVIKLNGDVVDDEDDEIFFYCYDGLNEILSLTKEGVEDFVIIAETVSFTGSI